MSVLPDGSHCVSGWANTVVRWLKQEGRVDKTEEMTKWYNQRKPLIYCQNEITTAVCVDTPLGKGLFSIWCNLPGNSLCGFSENHKHIDSDTVTPGLELVPFVFFFRVIQINVFKEKSIWEGLFPHAHPNRLASCCWRKVCKLSQQLYSWMTQPIHKRALPSTLSYKAKHCTL